VSVLGFFFAPSSAILKAPLSYGAALVFRPD